MLMLLGVKRHIVHISFESAKLPCCIKDKLEWFKDSTVWFCVNSHYCIICKPADVESLCKKGKK